MTIQQIYKLAIELGIKHDLRGPAKVKKYLERAKKKYDKLPKDEQTEFDMEKLTNPYSDTRILYDGGKDVKKILAGIDIEVSELLLGDKLGDIDLAFSHHPHGAALADLHSVMDLQAEVLADCGVPINIAEDLIKPRMGEISRKFAPANLYRAVDAAKILKMNFMCAHTTCDNMAATFIQKLIKKNKPETVGDILEILKQVPEYKEATKMKIGPTLFTGSPENYAGRIVVTEFTGGTSPAKEIYEKMADAGIGTIIGMHMHEEHRQEAEKYHINAVIAGHMASDSLGVNLFLDELERKGIKIVPVSGLIRVKRK